MNRTDFYAKVRPIFGGTLSQKQVDGLNDVRPTLAAANSGNHRPADTKLGCQQSVIFPRLRSALNLRNQCAREFSGVAVAKRVPSADKHIAHVLLMRSKLQVARVTAWRVVALMTDAHTFWNGLHVGQLPRDDMSVFKAINTPACANLASAKRVSPSLPLPTFVFAALHHLGPQAFCNRLHHYVIGFGAMFHAHAVALHEG